MYETILLPTDGSEAALAAAAEGLELAATTRGTVHVLYVLDERRAPLDWDPVTERFEAEGERAVEAIEAQASEGVTVEKHLRRGLPHKEILTAAERYSVELIVMGTHGRTGIDRFKNAGSVTERVVRFATVPVLAV